MKAGIEAHDLRESWDCIDETLDRYQAVGLMIGGQRDQLGQIVKQGRADTCGAVMLAAAMHDAMTGCSDGQAIIPDYTFTSTGLAPLLTGMTVKLCDVEFDTANIDTHLIESLITDKTRAIVPVDYAGHPCHIDKINALAKKHNLVVVHDSAQSCGSKFQGEYVGRQALVSCFSFHATKNLVTGEGGCPG